MIGFRADAIYESIALLEKQLENCTSSQRKLKSFHFLSQKVEKLKAEYDSLTKIL